MEEPQQMFLLLGRVEGKVDALLSAQAHSDKRVGNLEGRIDRLETLRERGTGAVNTIKFLWVAGAALVGLFAVQLKEFFFR